MLLLAITNKLCQDVAVIPFLWVLPLALYLLSFILCFDNPRWYARAPFGLALVAALGGMCWALVQGVEVSLRLQITILSAGLFICCMVCHGELYRLRPDPRQLTGFYLMIATGGALGGLFVAVAAPRLFTDYHEVHWGLLGCGLLFTVVCLRERSAENWRPWRALACGLTLLACGGLDRALVWLSREQPTIAGGWITALRFAIWGTLGLIVATWLWRRRVQSTVDKRARDSSSPSSSSLVLENAPGVEDEGRGRRTSTKTCRSVETSSQPFRFWRALACAGLLCGVAVLGAALWLEARGADAQCVARSRNFYGTLKVCEYRKDEPEGHYFLLQHGRISHGLQFVDAHRATWPTTYFGEASGIGLAMRALPAGARRIGVAGLGTGTLAAYGRAGDSWRIYEINPEVRRLATARFSYLRNCPAQVQIVLGDARLSLEREPPQQFDLLALDAFNSDAVPVHLLTREAFALYDRHVKTNGLIAVNISNRYLDLEPVVVNVARHFGYTLASISYEEGELDDEEEETKWWLYASSWILLTHDPALLNSPAIRSAASPAKTNAARIRLWTDDFASVFQLLQ